jgi:two-component system, chemotaxis family, protein-glutamate methylesterase/glutaminase
VQVDHCVPLERIAPLLVRLTQEPIPTISEMESAAVPRELDVEIKIAQGEHARQAGVVTELGDPSLFTCPECHGTLIKLRDEHPIRFRCHTRHAFTADSLLSELTENIEQLLWTSVRSVEVMLLRHLAQHLAKSGRNDEAEKYLRRAAQSQLRADLVRQAAAQHEHLSISRMQNE